MYTHMNIYIYMNECMHMNIYVYIYIHIVFRNWHLYTALRTTYIQNSHRDSYTEICLSIYICRYTNTYCFQDGVRRD